MEAKIFMSLSQLIKSLLGTFLLGIILGSIIGALLFLKFKKHFR
ncbi:hypothetical protein N4T77_18430 [Clostridium sp. CX1]|nr:hypothetical protein [Clostridium sp. CX1]MCT8978570.1 hypothetical protein [Clostridium sp. CX1]